ncbi:hypothetical protein DSCW_31980 [Desulfosarcina widdelii]|uniref:Uncharacterized protein n=1 Tax=Desulfosarcina widdelii TaxID=947919 RepID=A0A5K7Z7U4_9BACT|nr:hypothetical protein [Desulfosarcina widdelii]BBO75781.1 hypothetical protein DSCW_31980 [Desulfosarcina widdelii]
MDRSTTDSVRNMTSFSFTGSAKSRAEKTSQTARLNGGYEEVVSIEGRIHDIDWNITRVEEKLGQAIVARRNCKLALKEEVKGSSEHNGITAESARLDKEIDVLNGKLKKLKDRRSVRSKELEKSLKLYQVSIDRDMGNAGRSNMVEKIRSAVADATDYGNTVYAELDGLEKKYGSKLVKSAREKIDSAFKVVTAVEKALR